MPKAAVILSGCGFQDGAEVQESVLTLFFLEQCGIEAVCYAPDRAQAKVVNHLTGEEVSETRNVLVESARIARGKIRPLADATMDGVDALVMPGGFGAALNLSDLASAGPDATVDPDLVRLATTSLHQKKPIVAICISPAVLAAALKNLDVCARLTIGEDEGTAAAIRALGAEHENCPVEKAVIDEDNKIISTGAYMFDSDPKSVGAGIQAAINKLAQWLS